MPVQSYLWCLVPLVALLYLYFGRRRATSRYMTEHASYRASSLAERLGLTLVQGDPNFNFFIQDAGASVRARGSPDVEIRMSGRRGDLPLELALLKRIEQEPRLLATTGHVTFDCRMTVRASRPFAPFEVTSRRAPLGPIAREQSTPPVTTGSQEVDAEYLVTTRDPELAHRLGQLLPRFSAFAESGIHLVGDGKTVSFVMDRSKAPLIAIALYRAEIMADRLSELARRLTT